MGDDLERAIAALEGGGVVCVPTDTVYGLAATPANANRIVDIKRRDPNKSMQLLIPDASWLVRYAHVTTDISMLAETFWPGPLTIVAQANEEAPEELAPNGTIGLRVPDHPIALDLLARVGPLAASSANLSGDAPATDVEAIRALFGDEVEVYLDGGTIVGTGSTVVDAATEPWRLLRAGAVSEADIERTVGKSRFEAR